MCTHVSMAHVSPDGASPEGLPTCGVDVWRLQTLSSSKLRRLLSDKLGRFPVICTGLVLCGAGSLLLGPLPWLPLPPAAHASVWAAMLVLGLGVALAFTPITPAILQAAEAKVDPAFESAYAGVADSVMPHCWHMQELPIASPDFAAPVECGKSSTGLISQPPAVGRQGAGAGGPGFGHHQWGLLPRVSSFRCLTPSILLLCLLLTMHVMLP